MNRQNVQENFVELLRIIKTLRSPDGCPWDRKQTHQSLMPFMLEEAHEVVAAIEDDKLDELAGELGDVLLQVVLHAEIAGERIDQGLERWFQYVESFKCDLHEIDPSTSACLRTVKVESSEQVIENWQRLKIAEKDSLSETFLLDSVSRSLPQLIVAQKYQERAALTGFDWDNIGDVLDKVKEEFKEVNTGVGQSEFDTRRGGAWRPAFCCRQSMQVCKNQCRRSFAESQ